jgi:4-hydroxyphenylpyruvate dioxygenase
MTSYQKPIEADRSQHLQRFHHVTFWVGNAKQAAAFYCAQLGFRPIAYRGLETGSRQIVSHVIQNGQIVFVLESALTGDQKEMADHLVRHGDAVKDIAFEVDNLDAIFSAIQAQHPSTVLKPIEKLEDKHGSVRIARIKTFGDMTHTLVQVDKYSGPFMPGFQDPFYKVRDKAAIKHCLIC